MEYPNPYVIAIKEYKKLCKTNFPSVLEWLGLPFPPDSWAASSVWPPVGLLSCRPPGMRWHHTPLYTRSDGWQQANPAPAQPCSTPPHSQQGGLGEGLREKDGGNGGWTSLLWQGMRDYDPKTMISASILPGLCDQDADFRAERKHRASFYISS